MVTLIIKMTDGEKYVTKCTYYTLGTDLRTYDSDKKLLEVFSLKHIQSITQPLYGEFF